LEENKRFSCKVIKQINLQVDCVAKNSNLAIGDLILCINNEIKFNDLTCKQLENYLDSYNGYMRILLLSKENVESLLLAQNDKLQTDNQQNEQQQPYQHHQQRQDNSVIFEESDDNFANYNTTTQLITKLTDSQLFANIDKLSIKSSFTSDQDSVDFEYMNKMSKNKSIKGLFAINQPTDNDKKPPEPPVVTNPSSTFDENFIKIDFTKLFKVNLQKNSSNELGFTVTKLPNGYSCIKEILHEPALCNRLLKTGDIIISVNKSSTKSLSHRDVVTFLRISTPNVELELYRPDQAIIIPYLNQRKQKQYARSLQNHVEDEDDDQLMEENEALSQQDEVVETLRNDEVIKPQSHDDTLTDDTVYYILYLALTKYKNLLFFKG
jgi:hypothetical protein